MYVDPTKITNYSYTTNELQAFWLFCLVVAGKTAKTQARLLEGFLNSLECVGSPFDKLTWAVIQDNLEERLKFSRLGQYGRLSRAFRESLSLDLRNCSVEDLEKVHGVGPKTSRLFVMHSRPNVRYAAIDTHILKLLRENGYDAPKSTPTGKKYRDLEQAFLKLADDAGMTPADFDLSTWKKYARQ